MKLDYAFRYPTAVRRLVDVFNMINKFKYDKKYSEYFTILDCIKDVHVDERCFIVGTAPSLNKTNLSLLKDEYVFGVNTLYKAIDRIGKTPQYWGITDVDVFKQIGLQVLELNTILFLTGKAGMHYLDNKDDYRYCRDPIVVKNLGRMNYWDRFGHDLKKGVYGGRTVVIDSCIQTAYHLGFSEVYLLGCDCDYSKGHHFDGKEHAHVKAKEAGKPMSEQVDRERVMDSYKVCRRAFECRGKKIVNCTVGGRLEVFPRMKLEDVICN